MNKDKIKEALKQAAWLLRQGNQHRAGHACDDAIVELEVADSPDMDGPVDSEEPYAKVVTLTKHWRVETPRADHYYSNQTDAEETAATINDAFKAGRSSLTGIDIEQEAANRYPYSLNKYDTDAEAIRQRRWDFIEGARFILSIKDGKGGGDAVQSDGPGASGVPSETDRPSVALAPPIAREELCDECGDPWSSHIGNLGNVYPCWKPSGKFTTDHQHEPSPPSQAPTP